ncbi:MAG: hypothetical protein WEC39_01025 [Patescibacteria group bacterium]
MSERIDEADIQVIVDRSRGAGIYLITALCPLCGRGVFVDFPISWQYGDGVFSTICAGFHEEGKTFQLCARKLEKPKPKRQLEIWGEVSNLNPEEEE